MKATLSIGILWKSFAIQLGNKTELVALINPHLQQSFIDGRAPIADRCIPTYSKLYRWQLPLGGHVTNLSLRNLKIFGHLFTSQVSMLPRGLLLRRMVFT